MRNKPSRPNNRILLWIGAAIAIAIIAIVVATVLPKAPGGGNYTISDNKVTIETTSIGSLGTVLSTDKGFVLYTYPPDAQSDITCYDRCAVNWPPVFLPDGVRAVAGPDVSGSLLGEVTDRNGKRVATYNGWPLYLYQGDVVASTATGQGQYRDGGYWYVIRSSGEVLTPSPQQ